MPNVFRDGRERLIEWIKEQLVGPTRYMKTKSEDEGFSLKGINPIERFPCGAIYPVFEGDGEDPATVELSELEDVTLARNDDDGKEEEPARRYVPPSSIGLSFCLSCDCAGFEVHFSAAYYEHKHHSWVRNEKSDFMDFSPPVRSFDKEHREIWDARAVVDVLWRKHEAGWIVTVSLCNNNHMPDYSNPKQFANERAKATLFEAKIEVFLQESAIMNYPEVDKSLLDEEEQEIALQYIEQKEYAIGHGTGVSWEFKNNKIEIKTDPLPVAEVPQITADIASDKVLSLQYLASILEHKDETIDSLTQFIKGYAQWIGKQEKDISCFPEEDKAIGARITDRMRIAEKRMYDGIELLCRDNMALLAFSLANQAMLSQMKQADKQKGKKIKYIYTWRPFQLAFLLTVIESATNEYSKHRDLVDLIWFPTGGGKTEAYFALIAYVILWRRLKYSSTSGGTAALMRYTL